MWVLSGGKKGESERKCIANEMPSAYIGTMDNLASDIADFIAKAQQSRLQFLYIQMETCKSALALAKIQAACGLYTSAKTETRRVERACHTTLRFLPKIDDDEQRELFTTQLSEIWNDLEVLEATLEQGQSAN
jgi:hypothetical protein